MEDDSKLKFKVVMDDRRADGAVETLVLARVSDLAFGKAVFQAATMKHHDRNVYLKDGTRVIDEHLGQPVKPPPVLAPDLKDWSVFLFRKKREHLGFVLAKDEASAIDAAMEKFNLRPEMRSKVAVQRTGAAR